MLKAKLVVVGGDAKAKEVNLKLPCVIGRGREATLTLPHPLVSRQHTEIFEKDGKLFVKDLGSLNGTFLNNNRLETEQPLEPNQLLTLGNVTFRAVYEIGDEIGDQIADDIGDAETLGVPGLTENERPSAETKPLDLETDRKEPKYSILDKETVYVDEEDSVAGDTDLSLIDDDKDVVKTSADKENRPPHASGTSDVFSGVETGEELPSKVSSVDGLPDAQATMSFSGEVNSGEGAPKSQVVDAVELEIEDATGQKDATGSSLDSFIKKLPK